MSGQLAFVAAAYIVTAIATAGLTIRSYATMRATERRADDVRARR